MADGTDDKGNTTGGSQDKTGTPGAGGAGGTGDTGKSFTQADLDRVVGERLAREREKYADYDQLKGASEELKKLKEAQMSETQKAEAARAEAEAKLKADLAAAEAKAKAKEDELAAAALVNLRLRLVLEAGLPVALADRVKGTDEATIKADIEELKKLVKPAGTSAVGTGTNPAGGAGEPTPDQIEKMSMPEYEEWRKKQKPG